MNLDELIIEGKQILNCEHFQDAFEKYKGWSQSIPDMLEKEGILPNKIGQIKVGMHFAETPFSSEENFSRLKVVVDETIKKLEKVTEGGMDILSRREAVFIIRQVLTNFYLHIKTMYYEKPHGNGTIKQEDLTRIKIGNEYDVQRILYSLLIPVFPKARVEVNTDSGYSGFRYDIYLDEYNLVIEVKCSRSNMTEKNLTDELGADAFHYQTETLFIFIYDKEGLIKNTAAFQAAHYRTKENFDKDVEVFIVQPVSL